MQPEHLTDFMPFVLLARTACETPELFNCLSAGH